MTAAHIFPKDDPYKPENPKIASQLVKKRFIKYDQHGRLAPTRKGTDYVDTHFLDMPLGPHQTYLQGHKKAKRLGRIDACYDYWTKFNKAWAKISACFQGQSTYGDGKATFTAYDEEGYYMPGRTWETKMSWSDFFDRMDRFKAKRISGIGNLPFAPQHHKTEMPGVPGHHRLTGFHKGLAKAIGLI